MSGTGALPMALTPALDAAPLLTLDEATAVGEQLHDRWRAMAGTAPLSRDDFGWTDMVQFVLREARERVGMRGNGALPMATTVGS